MAGQTSVLLGFDMENDVGSWTHGWSGIRHGTPKLLSLLDAKRVPATFFFTGEAAQRFPDMVREVHARGHEVGCHSLFHENVGDAAFDMPGLSPLLEEEIAPRISRATALIEAACGTRPVSFRCPRGWGSAALLRALDSLGYRADLSYLLHAHRGRLCPYHPSSEDWTREGSLGILEIPHFGDLRKVSRVPHGRDCDQWPLLRTRGSKELFRVSRDFVARVEARGLPAVLSLYLHPWEFIPLRRTYRTNEALIRFDSFLTKNTGDAALRELDRLIEDFKGVSARFQTARAFTEAWEREEQARGKLEG